VKFFTKHFGALDEILTNVLTNALLALDGFIEEVLEYVVVIRDVWVEVYSV